MRIGALTFGVRRQAKRDAAVKALSSLRSAGAVQVKLRDLPRSQFGGARLSEGSPSPLIPFPLGEGESMGARLVHLSNTSGVFRTEIFQTRQTRQMTLPLPAGEGRGEGEWCDDPGRCFQVSRCGTIFDCEGNRRGRRRFQGFTLIELILVMTLLAIVLAISSPSLSKFFKGRGLDNEARRFLALTRQAQSRAVFEGVPMVLWFDSESRTYGLNADKTFVEDDGKAEQFTVEPTVQIEIQHSADAKAAAESSQFKNEKLETTGVYRLRFNPDGFASAGSPETVVFRQEGNGELRVAQTRNRLSYEIQPGQPIQQR